MTKVMVVEDDQSLREIYSIRLTAEGYEVVSAGDGEEALAVAVKERPDLIVSDVMMPKISGFDMLDILRSTPETKDVKVIMMTALSSDDQRKRGESLGADKYLVKSQVGIEDVINSVKEVLSGRSSSPVGTVAAGIAIATTPGAPAQAQPAPAPAPAPNPGMPTQAPAPGAPAPTQPAPAPAQVPNAPAPAPAPNPGMPAPSPVPGTVTPVSPAPTPASAPNPGMPMNPTEGLANGQPAPGNPAQ